MRTFLTMFAFGSLTAILGFAGGGLFEINRPKPVTAPVAGFQVADCVGLLAMGYTDSEGNLYMFNSEFPPNEATYEVMKAVPVEGRYMIFVPCAGPANNNNNGESDAFIQARQGSPADPNRG